MIDLGRVSSIYGAASNLIRTHAAIELVSVADPAGGRFNNAVRVCIQLSTEDAPASWDEVVAIARHLRWRIATDPSPKRLEDSVQDFRERLGWLSHRTSALLDEYRQSALRELLIAAWDCLDESDAPMGNALVESLVEAGNDRCAIVLPSARARENTETWLASRFKDVRVVGLSQYLAGDFYDHAYFVGPPAVFGARATTSPRADGQSYFIPSWWADRSIPHSGLADYASSGFRPRSRIHGFGATTEVVVAPLKEDTLRPDPVWTKTSGHRAVSNDEALARRVLLSNSLSIFLDHDGDLIRTLDPHEEAGHRVELRPVPSIAIGAFLVLREGETESKALYDMALANLGDRGKGLVALQERWKERLTLRLDRSGATQSIAELSALGVLASRQVRAWTAETVSRPRRDLDFDILLRWLELDAGPHFEAANILRRARSRAASSVTKALEDSLASQDLTGLERDGFLSIDLDLPGFASMIAVRVLAIAPMDELVPRHELRVPRRDEQARWLE